MIMKFSKEGMEDSFNRYIVECKSYISSTGNQSCPVLIDT